jgi:uncharacterized protein YggE
MSDQPLLSVRGEAVLEVDPEIARVSITVAARDPDRATAMRLLNDRAGAIDAILNGFQDAFDNVETTAVRVSPQLKHRKGQERIWAYVATVHHTVTVVDFTRLGELIARLADQDLTEVAGPWWALRPESPLHRTARIAATHDAVQRARDYARALGSDLTELVELADARLLSDHGGGEMTRAFAGGMLKGREGAPEEFTFDIAPAKQTVRATVEARFRMAPPDLGRISP